MSSDKKDEIFNQEDGVCRNLRFVHGQRFFASRYKIKLNPSTIVPGKVIVSPVRGLAGYAFILGHGGIGYEVDSLRQPEG